MFVFVCLFLSVWLFLAIVFEFAGYRFSIGKCGMIGKYTAIDTSITNEFGTLFNIEINWTAYSDHAGFTFVFSLAKMRFEFLVHDVRHWDDEKGCFMDHPADDEDEE